MYKAIMSEEEMVNVLTAEGIDLFNGDAVIDYCIVADEATDRGYEFNEVDHTWEKNNYFNIVTHNKYTKGDLQGYIDGHIELIDKNGDTYNHEFLYRYDDAANGENFKLVTVDYGYHCPYIDEVWSSIENELKAIALS